MPEFAYQAVNRKGKKTKGSIKALDKNAAVNNLHAQDVYVLKINEIVGEVPWYKRDISFGQKVSIREIAVFCRQLSTLIHAGVAILDSVRVMSDQTDSKVLSKELAAMVTKLAEGRQLSEAAGERAKIFPKIFINMVRAGEITGNLDVILDRLAVFFEKEYYQREKIKSALTYPIIVGIISVIVTVFLLIEVVPTFVGIFASMHIQLPLPTRIVLAVSHFILTDWWMIVAIVVLLGTLHAISLRQERYLYFLDWLRLRVPVFGLLVKKSIVARMTRTLGSLFTSAVPILQSLNIVSEVVNNRVVAKVLSEAAVSLQTGGSLADPLRKSKLFPPLVTHMIAIGEQTGNLDFMLNKIADFYEVEVETMSDRLKTLIEPLMMIILSVIVGTIVTAVILPEFSLYSNLH